MTRLASGNSAAITFTLKEIAATGTQKGTNTLIVVDGTASASWAQSAYARGRYLRGPP